MRMDRFADGLKERLRLLSEVMERRQRRDSTLLGLTPTQVRVLSTLLENDGIPTGSLAEQLGLAPSTVTRICDVLVRKGLVERLQAEGDRRRVHLTLTPPGFRMARELDRWEGAAIDRLATGIGTGQREDLLANVDLLIEALTADVPRDEEW